VDKNGKVKYDWIDPRMKEVLAWFNKLYKEKYIDQALFSDPSTNMPPGSSSKWAENVFGKTFFVGLWNFGPGKKGIYAPSLEKNVPGAWFDWCEPPKGPYGDQVNETYGPMAGEGMAITKDCPKPDLAMKWLDYTFFTQDGNLLTNFYGQPGVTYTIDKDGWVMRTAGVKDGTVKSFKDAAGKEWFFDAKADAYVGGWGDQDSARMQLEDTYNDTYFSTNPDAQACTQATKKFLQPKFPFMLPSKEENEKIAQYPDIGLYQQQMIIKFVNGTEPLENFDQFVAQMKKLGIDEVTKVREAMYDRFIKS